MSLKTNELTLIIVWIDLFQRGSEELALSNGAVMSPQSNHADNNNDAKKVTQSNWIKLDSINIFSWKIKKRINFSKEFNLIQLKDEINLLWNQ